MKNKPQEERFPTPHQINTGDEMVEKTYPPKENDIIEEFEQEYWTEGGKELYNWLEPEQMQDLEDFFKKAISQAKQQARDEMKEDVKRLKKEEYFSCPITRCRENPEMCEHIGKWKGYNQAINDILNL